MLHWFTGMCSSKFNVAFLTSLRNQELDVWDFFRHQSLQGEDEGFCQRVRSLLDPDLARYPLDATVIREA